MAKDSPQREVLYGVHPVTAALTAGRRMIYVVYVIGDGKNKRRFDPVCSLAEQAGVRVVETKADQMERMAGSSAHQGVAAEVGRYPLATLDEVLGKKSGEADPFVLVADGIMDPHNLGALIRTAACVGVDGVVIPKDNAAPPTPAVSKASAGAMESMLLAREANIARVIERLKENNFWVFGLDGDGTTSLFEVDLTGPAALVIGGEGRGVRRLVKEKCDLVVAIPQKKIINSLNASVAGGVAMYEIDRQRREKQRSMI